MSVGKYIWLSVVLCAFGIFANRALAQQTLSPQDAAKALTSSSSSAGGPIGGNAPGMFISLPSLQLSIANGNGEVSGAYNHLLPFFGGAFPFWVTYGGIKIEVPTSQKTSTDGNAAPAGSGLTSIASSSQLPNGLKVSFPFFVVRLFNTVATAEYGENAYQYAVPKCTDDQAKTLISNLTALTQKAKAANQPIPPGITQLNTEIATKSPTLVSDACAGSDISNLAVINAYPPPGGLAFWSGMFIRPAITPSVQYLTDSYYLGKIPTQKSTKHVLPAVDVSVGWGVSFRTQAVDDPHIIQWLIVTPDFNYGATYKDKATKTECINTGSEVLNCINGPIGSPDIGKTETASLSTKIDFALGMPLLGTAATDLVAIPKYSYDAAVGGTSIDLPLYLVLKDSSSFYPGIDLNWTNIKHQFIIGAFVATSLGS